jgi:hypothetical protein
MKIIFDIDGTLADCRHRRHFVSDGNHDWKSFNESMVMDPPIKPIVYLLGTLSLEYDIKLVSGRNEDYRPHTLEWLESHTIGGFDLRMRPAGDYRPDEVIKEEILLQLKSEGWWPDLVIDDREQVVQMWRRHGIICLQNSMKEFSINKENENE